MSGDLSTAEAAERLGVTKRAIIRWVNEGVFPNAYKLNPRRITSPYRIPEEDVIAFEEERRGQRSANNN